MMPIHPSPDALLAWLDGDEAQPELERHLRECAQCRSTLFEARLLRLLLRSGQEAVKPAWPKEPHLDEQVLAAYYDESLTPDEAKRLEQHLSVCDSCLSGLLELHAALAPDAREPLSATAFHNAVHGLLAGRSRRPTLRAAVALFARGAQVVAHVVPLGGAGDPSVPGGVVVHAARQRLRDVVDEALRLVQFPAAAPEFGAPSFDADPASVRSIPSAPAPPEYLSMKLSGLAGRPASRLARSVLAFRDEVERALQLPLGDGVKSPWSVSAAPLQKWLAEEPPELPLPGRLAESVAMSLSPEEEAPAATAGGMPRRPQAIRPASLTVDFGPTRLHVVAEPDPVGARLRIAARNSLKGAPTIGLTLRLSEEAGDTIAAETDERGEAVFLLKPGLARLSQGDRPEMQILLLVVTASSPL